MGKRIKKLDKAQRKVSKYINKKVGGEDLAEYAGAKMARLAAKKGTKKYIKSNATKKQAKASAKKVASNTAMLVGGVGAKVGARAAGVANKTRLALKARRLKRAKMGLGPKVKLKGMVTKKKRKPTIKSKLTRLVRRKKI